MIFNVGVQANNSKSVVSSTLLASGWQGSTAPYTYNLNIANDIDVEVLLANTATKAIADAVTKAQIAGNGNDNILRAWGDKPTINIPVILRMEAN